MLKLKFYASGRCSQLERTILSTGEFKVISIPATCTLIEHPVQGLILFDTGYSMRIVETNKKLPFSIVSKLAPLKIKEEDVLVNQLKAQGISAESINYVIVSHFHLDHMGGLKDFPKAKFIVSETAYHSVRHLSGFEATKMGFLPELLPDDFWDRCQLISEEKLGGNKLDYPIFDKGYDLFNDQSIILVSLPGHSEGQMGAYLQTQEGIVFLVGDACWRRRSFRELAYPSIFARILNHDNKVYDETLKKLYEFHKLRPEIDIVPSHCDETCFENNPG